MCTQLRRDHSCLWADAVVLLRLLSGLGANDAVRGDDTHTAVLPPSQRPGGAYDLVRLSPLPFPLALARARALRLPVSRTHTRCYTRRRALPPMHHRGEWEECQKCQKDFGRTAGEHKKGTLKEWSKEEGFSNPPTPEELIAKFGAPPPRFPPSSLCLPAAYMLCASALCPLSAVRLFHSALPCAVPLCSTPLCFVGSVCVSHHAARACHAGAFHIGTLPCRGRGLGVALMLTNRWILELEYPVSSGSNDVEFLCRCAQAIRMSLLSAKRSPLPTVQDAALPSPSDPVFCWR